MYSCLAWPLYSAKSFVMHGKEKRKFIDSPWILQMNANGKKYLTDSAAQLKFPLDHLMPHTAHTTHTKR